MQHFEGSFRLAPAPQALVARLIDQFEEFEHIQEAAPRIAVLFSERVLMVHGGRAAAFIGAPRWQGPTANLVAFLLAELCRPLLDGHDPDYFIVVDRPIWDSLDGERQERLMFHELSHLQVVEDEFGVPRRSRETGQPLLKLVPHDFEVFSSEIVRYGVDTCDLLGLTEAIVEGETRKRRRGLKIA